MKYLLMDTNIFLDMIIDRKNNVSKELVNTFIKLLDFNQVKLIIPAIVAFECKCYTWTIGNNSPSAKLSTLNEAVLYMSHLPSKTIKIIAMKQTYSPARAESLAQYYCRMYGHLLRDIEVWEFAEDGTHMVVYSRSLLKHVVQAPNVYPKIDSMVNMNELWWHGTEQQ